MEAEKKQEGRPTTKPTAADETKQDEATGTAGAALNQEATAGEAAPVAYKGKRMAKVSQEYIDVLQKEIATCTGMYSERKTRSMAYILEGGSKGKGSLDLAPFVARIDAIRAELRAGDARILEQYHRQGYAFAEVEEESFANDDVDEKICGTVERSMPLPPPA
jgi:hypothetical protein